MFVLTFVVMSVPNLTFRCFCLKIMKMEHFMLTENLTFTPIAGASLIIEILRGLLYQKTQLPFPYSFLKRVVEKRRLQLIGETVKRKVNFSHESHFRTVSTAYDHLERLSKGIFKEFSDGHVAEVVILFGPNAFCPVSVFSVTLPPTVLGHNESRHAEELTRNIQRVLRSMFLSQAWVDSIDTNTVCTNTYVYLKKHHKTGHVESKSEIFELCQPLNVSPKVKQSRFCLKFVENDKTQCDCRFDIFSEDATKVTTQIDLEPLNEVVWLKSKGPLKGFKDSFVNKVSVCELW